MSDAPGNRPPSDVQSTNRRPWSPQRALNWARLIAAMLTEVAFLLTFVLWFMSRSPHSGWSQPPAFQAEWVVMLAIGAIGAAASSFVAGFAGRRAARDWARLAGPGNQGGVSNSPSAPARPTAPPPGVWGAFVTPAVIGSALPEVALLMGFVVTFMSYRWPVMFGSLFVYFVFWALNFPRRSQWDQWASSAGLSVPWDLAPATMASSPGGPVSDISTTPR